jgi:hypothetical protein
MRSVHDDMMIMVIHMAHMMITVMMITDMLRVDMEVDTISFLIHFFYGF